tara:strand:- start:578 stop:1423 length:846 start_codon:yes stop_codon:yes gene_type:complete
MSNNKISYQGQPGAYSDLACQEAAANYTPLPCETFKSAFDAVQNGDAARAMIPIDNSLAGRVADIHRLMPDSNLFIVGEHFLPIHHNLLGLPGTDISDITEVYSHVHALPQCEKLIRELGVKPIVYGDTALSAKMVSEKGERHRASISSSAAAEIYGLEILRANIEDHANNTTRFVILDPKIDVPAYNPDQKYVTTLMFRLRSLPAVLYKCLGGFATNGVNLTKLESYMVEGDFNKVEFYCDVEAHIEDPAMAFALEELAFYTDEIRNFGTYPASAFRYDG